VSSLFSLILLSLPAHAGVFLEVQEPVEVPLAQAHGWIRTFPDEEGWWFGHGVGGDYAINHLTDDLVADVVDNHYLTERDDLKDHALTRCPDGGFLHASFAQVDGVDTHHTFRYDADWNRVAANVVIDADPEARCSDMPVLCSDLMNATAYSEGMWPEYHLMLLDDSGAALDVITLPEAPPAQGSALLADPDRNSVLILGAGDPPYDELYLQRYDADSFDLLEDRVLEVPFDDTRRVFWPQGFMRVGDHYLMAYVVTTEASGVFADTGDIWLSAYDADWNLVEATAVAEEPVEWWAYMRPGLGRKGDRLLVSFDHQNGKFLAQVVLDLVALGAEQDDSGLFDTGPIGWDSDQPGDDTGTPEGDGGGDGDCGCATAGVGSSWLALGLIGLLARRRR